MGVKRVVNCITYKSNSNYGFKIYVDGLLRIFQGRDTLFVFPIGEERIIDTIKSIGSEARIIFVKRTILWIFTLSIVLRRYQPDFVYHTMNYGPLLRISGGIDVIIHHDLKWRHHGFPATLARRLQRSLFLSYALYTKCKFIAISEWTAYDFLCHTGRNVDAIVPNYLAQEIDLASSLDENLGKFVLSISANQSYKDLEYMEQAFYLSEICDTHRLIIVSKGFNRSNPFTTVLSDLHNNEINSLLQNSDCVIVPSLFEGFGFPYFEGLAYNKKVLSFANPIALSLSQRGYSVFCYDKVDVHLNNLLNDLMNLGNCGKQFKKRASKDLLNVYEKFEQKCSS